MERAHKQGMRTTATMMFGHEEEPRHRLDHLFAVREVQDRTHGFTAFIPWTFQPAHTRINVTASLPAPAYLRLLAVSRLVLDNIANIQSSWVTMGPEVAQLALFYGANDFGSLMIEENVVAAAGVSYHLTRHEIHKIDPCRRLHPRAAHHELHPRGPAARRLADHKGTRRGGGPPFVNKRCGLPLELPLHAKKLCPGLSHAAGPGIVSGMGNGKKRGLSCRSTGATGAGISRRCRENPRRRKKTEKRT